MSTLDQVLSDLTAESLQLDQWVAGLTEAGWSTVTTPEGWTVTDQIAHLHWTDIASLSAIREPAAFGAMLTAAASDADGFIDAQTADVALIPPADLLLLWRDGRVELDAALREVPDGEKIPWFGPPMSPASMATARIMETWAHGHDVGEALGITILPSARTRHVCHIGVRARRYSYLVRGEQDPGVEIRVELTGPDGELWAWGPEDAAERVTGSGQDFALLATRRRHLDDVDVRAQGPHAQHWLTIVQAFAGQPGADPVRLADR
ncbi:TIGR03084 family metal-binding protein [Aeromicrobium wangtongii]|uniref:TIGR03084 family metal-binding protein n=1 Tax=Aeromicrobium wangtongii TaxID=2969247 RepID=UPI002016B9BF|nr:TIGR03084 family metal-binding protein [Aeromicrobium wangtongii]MCL3817022.1 TIGR03084 family metal-binding protein [Aeromicrobium wangtongii]